MFRDSMKSFISGHSGFSFYCCVFIILYLQNRLNYILGLRNKEKTSYWPMYILKGLRIFRPFIQGGLLSLASYIAMTRISDYMHHPMVRKLQWSQSFLFMPFIITGCCCWRPLRYDYGHFYLLFHSQSAKDTINFPHFRWQQRNGRGSNGAKCKQGQWNEFKCHPIITLPKFESHYSIFLDQLSSKSFVFCPEKNYL